MKKTILITSICLIVALLCGILCLALYQKDFSYEFEKPNIIEVNGNTADSTKLDPNKIFEELTTSSKKSIMQAAFNKKQIKKPTINKNVLTTFSQKQKFAVSLRYTQEQVLKLNGKNYVDEYNSQNDEIKYKELKFELDAENKDIMLKIYVMDLNRTDRYYYVISQFGDYSDLYNYLNSIENL